MCFIAADGCRFVTTIFGSSDRMFDTSFESGLGEQLTGDGTVDEQGRIVGLR